MRAASATTEPASAGRGRALDDYRRRAEAFDAAGIARTRAGAEALERRVTGTAAFDPAPLLVSADPSAMDDERKRHYGPTHGTRCRHDVAVCELAIGGSSSTVAVATRRKQ
jgi:hypothetical protein